MPRMKLFDSLLQRLVNGQSRVRLGHGIPSAWYLGSQDPTYDSDQEIFSLAFFAFTSFKLRADLVVLARIVNNYFLILLA